MHEEQVINAIYEAAVVPNGWPQLLGKLAGHFGALGGVLFARHCNDVQWLGSAIGEDVYQQLLTNGWGSEDDRLQRLITRQHPGFLTDADVCSADILDTSPLYRKLLKPAGFHAAAATVITQADRELVLTIEGFPSHEVARQSLPGLDRLRPHLARAGMLTACFGMERSRTAVSVLQEVSAPAAILATGRRLLATNNLFERHFNDYYYDSPAGLRLRDLNADRKLSSALRSLSGKQGGLMHGVSLPIRSVHDGSQLVLNIVPVRGAGRDIFSGATAILLLAVPGARLVPSEDLIQNLLNLTPSEARLAHAIASGLRITEAARNAGVVVSTARTHLKSIFTKTGVSRQSDLVGLLASLITPIR